MTAQEIAEYQKILLDVREIEKKIQDYFVVLSQNESIQYDRCSDFGERGISIFIPFDNVNLSAFRTDQVEKIKSDLAIFHDLRNKQRRLELLVHSQKSTNAINKLGTQGIE